MRGHIQLSAHIEGPVIMGRSLLPVYVHRSHGTMAPGCVA